MQLTLVLERQAAHMRDLLLRWQNEISPFILCSHLVCSYGNVQMEKPVSGNLHEPLPKEGGDISLLPSPPDW